jgi:hypothetical protein
MATKGILEIIKQQEKRLAYLKSNRDTTRELGNDDSVAKLELEILEKEDTIEKLKSIN